MSPVTRTDFDELVTNTTKYLENILSRLKAVEEQLAEQSKPVRKAKTND